MPWIYRDIMPFDMPPCPWCHRVDAGKRNTNRMNRYACDACRTTFEAHFEAEPAPAQPVQAQTEGEQDG